MHPSQLLLLISCLWLVDCSIMTPSTSDPPNRRSHQLNHRHSFKKSQSKNLRSPKSIADSGCMTTDATSYTGNASTTESGMACQIWSDIDDYDYYTDVGEHNYCRSPDGGKKVWCFTTDPVIRWEYCDVPFCIAYTKGIR